MKLLVERERGRGEREIERQIERKKVVEIASGNTGRVSSDDHPSLNRSCQNTEKHVESTLIHHRQLANQSLHSKTINIDLHRSIVFFFYSTFFFVPFYFMNNSIQLIETIIILCDCLLFIVNGEWFGNGEIENERLLIAHSFDALCICEISGET